MKTKSQLWVSAVLYIALGVIIITLVLAAGIPLVNKMRDKNTVVQSKDMMFSIDENIRAVANEGPGSRRFISPLSIEEGELIVDEDDDMDDDDKDNIMWKMTTSSQLMEPNTDFPEGPLTMRLVPGVTEDEYELELVLDYCCDEAYRIAKISLDSNSLKSPFKGKFSLLIEHTGTYTDVGIIPGQTVEVPNIQLKLT